MKKLFIVLLALLTLSTMASAQRVRVKVDVGKTSEYKYSIGDIVQIGGELGIVFSLTSDRQHGKAISLAMTQCDWRSAHQWCSQLGWGWKLPTKNELHVIYKHKDTINSQLDANGYYQFSGSYWSGEEYSNGSAWRVGMDHGSAYDFDKVFTTSVRAVSAF